jgi:hypothetical protein
MDTTLKMTKQGIRDLNSYGPRAKPVAPDASVPAEPSGSPAADGAASAAAVGPVLVGGAVVTTPDGGSS